MPTGTADIGDAISWRRAALTTWMQDENIICEQCDCCWIGHNRETNFAIISEICPRECTKFLQRSTAANFVGVKTFFFVVKFELTEVVGMWLKFVMRLPRYFKFPQTVYILLAKKWGSNTIVHVYWIYQSQWNDETSLFACTALEIRENSSMTFRDWSIEIWFLPCREWMSQ